MKNRETLYLCVVTFLMISYVFSQPVSAQSGKVPNLENHSDMILIPAGEFVMGILPKEKMEILEEFFSDESFSETAAIMELTKEKYVQSDIFDELPQHKVNLPAYYIDKFEVTNGKFCTFLNEKGNKMVGGALWIDLKNEFVPHAIQNVQGKFTVKSGFENLPVTFVTWFGARAYATWAGSRLPTEEEWEKAARGTDARRYPWGNSLPDTKKTKMETDMEDGIFTAPVGSFVGDKSPFGVMDMAGNVCEWSADTYEKGKYANQSGSQAQSPDAKGRKVVRGGSSMKAVPAQFRVTDRTPTDPTICAGDLGFRCVKDLPESKK